MNTSTERERAFIAYLVGLAGEGLTGDARREKRKNLAALAALRRGLGKRPGEAPEMFPYVVPFVSDQPRQQDAYFLVASLFAAHQLMWPRSTDTHEPTNLGASFRWLRRKAASASIEKRFIALLDAEREELPEHLRHAVSLLKAHDVPVDWLRLLSDLRGWDWDSHWIQRAWAAAYWRIGSSELGQSPQPTTSSKLG